MTTVPVLVTLEGDLPWWAAVVEATNDVASTHRSGRVATARASAIRTFLVHRWEDAWHAFADALMFGASPAWSAADEAPGIVGFLEADVGRVRACLRSWDAWSTDHPHEPVAAHLAPPPSGVVATLAATLAGDATDDAVVTWVREVRRTRGGGPLGRHVAYRWTDVGVVGVQRPRLESVGTLVGLDRQWERLRANTEAFLRGDPAMHVLAYGPRGSGKSTLVRSLLDVYAEAGLRMIEVPAGQLLRLPDVVSALAGRPEKFIVFVDDLAFEFGDAAYAPLKSLLDGSLAADDAFVRLYATSNRRHLVQERLADRPDPLDDDVHAWDTHHERLALSDRFGLTVTFPSYDRKAYLEVVAHRMQVAGVDPAAYEDWTDRADRFARLGNGLSGRTAAQFVDALRAGLA